MCGIAGIWSCDGRPIDESALRRMGAVLAHRGPDGEGVHVDNGPRVSAGLLNRRLAVIDVEGGGQPMSDERGRHTIVYNGELFNAEEVRRALESLGHRFRTRCDTEVVLRGYVQWGEAVLDRLNGMWAFAIWDGAERRLTLARDRLGVKPLVYADTPAGFAFGSEIKALTASGLVARELDPGALPHYLSFFAVPEPYSLVRGVRRLPAGHVLVVDGAGVRERQYWDCALPEEEDRGAQHYLDEVHELLEDSVRRRLVSDVPLGVLLSAGVDSKVLAALAARHVDSPLRTFTLGFNVPAFDERGPAREMARWLGAEHAEAEVDFRGAVGSLPELLNAYDEPGQSLLQTHFVCELASRTVTVALSGLGGDELFSSYPTHVVVNMLANLDRVPEAFRGPALALARAAPSARLGRAAQLAAMEPDERAARRLMHQTDASLRRELLAGDVRAAVDLDAPARHLEMHFERAQGKHPLNRLLYVYIKTYLTDELLRASDAMSMHHSLELRTPFLDYRLVERAMSMPAHHKMRLTTGKLVLRELGERVLPGAIPRKKKGFSPPLSAWMKGDLQESVRDVLAPRAIRERGVFDPAAVERVVSGCLNGDARLVPPVMMLYSFESWAQRWLDDHASGAGDERAAPVHLNGAKPPPECDLSVIVVNWNTRERLRDCLASLEHLASVDHEVIVVDNASSDGSVEMVAADFPSVRTVQNRENVGFGAANNQAMKLARGRWSLLLNSDTVLLDESVARLFERIESESDIGVAHCRLVFPGGRQQHTVYRFPSVRLAIVEDLGLYKLMSHERAGSTLLSGYFDYEEERDVDWVAGAFMLMPRRVFEVTGGFDERFFMYGEDLDWCYRIRDHGWRIRYYPQATIVHADHSSSEIRWGDERVVLCLSRQQEIYRERNGAGRAATFMALRLTGAGLRTAYYSLRHLLGGPRAEAYGEMRKLTSHSLRALVALARR